MKQVIHFSKNIPTMNDVIDVPMETIQASYIVGDVVANFKN